MTDPRSLPDIAHRIPRDRLPELIGALAEAGAIAQRRLLEPIAPEVPAEAERLLDAGEMATRLGLRPSWLLEMARQGRVPHVRLGKFVRFRPGEVLAWSENRRLQEG